MKKIIKELKELKVKVKENFNIKKLTSFKIGGKVELYMEIADIDRLVKVINILKKYKKKWLVLGNMTNILVSENKIKRAVIVLTGTFRKILKKDNKIIYVGAGVKIKDLIKFIIKNSIGGLEFLAGIPGTFGGAVFMNAGAFGQSVSNIIKKIYTVTPEIEIKTIINKRKIFDYRKSIFQRNKYIILGADVLYDKKNKNIIKKDINKILKLRQKKHPYEYPSAGSFFKNSKEYSAGDLIERAGLKGFRIGNAEVSQKHANFIINKGGAKFSDVLKLANLIKKEVYKKFNIKLQEEVRIIK